MVLSQIPPILYPARTCLNRDSRGLLRFDECGAIGLSVAFAKKAAVCSGTYFASAVCLFHLPPELWGHAPLGSTNSPPQGQFVSADLVICQHPNLDAHFPDQISNRMAVSDHELHRLGIEP